MCWSYVVIARRWLSRCVVLLALSAIVFILSSVQFDCKVCRCAIARVNRVGDYFWSVWQGRPKADSQRIVGQRTNNASECVPFAGHHYISESTILSGRLDHCAPSARPPVTEIISSRHNNQVSSYTTGRVLSLSPRRIIAPFVHLPSLGYTFFCIRTCISGYIICKHCFSFAST